MEGSYKEAGFSVMWEARICQGWRCSTKDLKTGINLAMAAGGTAEEDASQCIFPKEFEAAETLLNSEVRMLLEHRKPQNESAG